LAGGRNLRAQAKFGKAGGYGKSVAARARNPDADTAKRAWRRRLTLSQKEMAGTSPAMTFDVDRS
jgi:hypothetical protein